MLRLQRKFFERPTLEVAKQLLGKIIFYNGQYGFITETEAYIGQDDPACHAARGKTNRNFPMFGDAGRSYVYLIYGMYHCLNIVTECSGFPAAVLVRGLEIHGENKNLHLDGPGKLCRYLKITRADNNLDLTTNKNFYLTESKIKFNFKATPRIGIKVGLTKKWRFVRCLP